MGKDCTVGSVLSRHLKAARGVAVATRYCPGTAIFDPSREFAETARLSHAGPQPLLANARLQRRGRVSLTPWYFGIPRMTAGPSLAVSEFRGAYPRPHRAARSCGTERQFSYYGNLVVNAIAASCHHYPAARYHNRNLRLFAYPEFGLLQVVKFSSCQLVPVSGYSTSSQVVRAMTRHPYHQLSLQNWNMITPSTAGAGQTRLLLTDMDS